MSKHLPVTESRYVDIMKFKFNGLWLRNLNVSISDLKPIVKENIGNIDAVVVVVVVL